MAGNLKNKAQSLNDGIFFATVVSMRVRRFEGCVNDIIRSGDLVSDLEVCRLPGVNWYLKHDAQKSHSMVIMSLST